MKDPRSFPLVLAALLVVLCVAGLVRERQFQRSLALLQDDVAALMFQARLGAGAHVSPPMAVSPTTAADPMAKEDAFTKGYFVKKGALLDADGNTVVPDLVAAGLNPVDCDISEGVAVYLALPNEIVFAEGCGEMPSGTMWSYSFRTRLVTKRKLSIAYGSGSAETPDRRYQVSFGPADQDGEVRSLIIKDFVLDDAFTTAKLGQGYTYVSSYSEFDGGPMGSLQPEQLNGDSVRWFTVDVFDANVPVRGYLDNRHPILTRSVSVFEEQP